MTTTLTTTLTTFDYPAIYEQIRTIPLVHGLGTTDSPCSVAALNLAINGKLSDADPSGCYAARAAAYAAYAARAAAYAAMWRAFDPASTLTKMVGTQCLL
jgi:hypothetical protein